MDIYDYIIVFILNLCVVNTLVDLIAYTIFKFRERRKKLEGKNNNAAASDPGDPG